MADSEDEGYSSDDSGSNVPLANRKVVCYCTKCQSFTGCKGQPGCTCSCPVCVPKEIAAGAGVGAESGSH
jgi:hypothetical protein